VDIESGIARSWGDDYFSRTSNTLESLDQNVMNE